MLDDIAAIAEQLRAARRDSEAQRKMKATARDQRNRVTTLLTAAVGVLKKLEGQHSANAPINFEQVADKVQEIYNAYMTPGAVVEPDEDAPQPISTPEPKKPEQGKVFVRVLLDKGDHSVVLEYDNMGDAEEAAAFIAINGVRTVSSEGTIGLMPVHRVHYVAVYREA